jgi:hypothetical protein
MFCALAHNECSVDGKHACRAIINERAQVGALVACHLKSKGVLLMPRGDKGSYTDKQKRKAEHIEEGYKKKGGQKKSS